MGSIAAVTDANGALLERLAYEPFGKRRHANGAADDGGVLAGATTKRGFTGHEMIDDMGLINMNGRLYDPAIGRFVSPDPLDQDPYVSIHPLPTAHQRPLGQSETETEEVLVSC
jgi:RHS repeat-associated protein